MVQNARSLPQSCTMDHSAPFSSPVLVHLARMVVRGDFHSCIVLLDPSFPVYELDALLCRAMYSSAFPLQLNRCGPRSSEVTARLHSLYTSSLRCSSVLVCTSSLV